MDRPSTGLRARGRAGAVRNHIPSGTPGRRGFRVPRVRTLRTAQRARELPRRTCDRPISSAYLSRGTGAFSRCHTRDRASRRARGRAYLWSFGTSPLFGHRGGDAGQRATAFFPAIRPGRGAMHARCPSLNDVRWCQMWQILQPEASGLRLAVSELPRLNDLVRFTNARRNNRDRVLDCNTSNVPRTHEVVDKIEGLRLLTLLALEPSRSTNGQVSAGRMSDHEIPRLV